MSGLRTRLNSFTSVSIIWGPPEERNGIIIAYEVTYRVNNSDARTENTTNLNTMLDLEFAPNTRISSIRVRAYTIIGPGPNDDTRDITLSPRELALPYFF